MRFNDVLGHTKTLGIIGAYLENSRFSGAFIFSGPEGIGKKMVAKRSFNYFGKRTWSTCCQTIYREGN